MQLGLKGLHSHQTIHVRENRLREESLEEQVLLVLYSAAFELLVYLDSDNVTSYEDDFDILLWCRDHKLTYPILSIMAKDIMSVHVSTCSSESCFSCQKDHRRTTPALVT